LLVIVACSGVYTWWQKSRRIPATPPPSVAVEPAPGKTAEPTEGRQQASAPEAKPEPAAQPVSSAMALENAAGTLHVALTAAEATWVRATANGKVVYSGILQPNETKSLDAADTVTLRIGNAGGVSISLNGKSIPAVGPKGQVRIVQLSPDGEVQVEPPVKPQPAPQPAQTL